MKTINVKYQNRGVRVGEVKAMGRVD